MGSCLVSQVVVFAILRLKLPTAFGTCFRSCFDKSCKQRASIIPSNLVFLWHDLALYGDVINNFLFMFTLVSDSKQEFNCNPTMRVKLTTINSILMRTPLMASSKIYVHSVNSIAKRFLLKTKLYILRMSILTRN